MLFFTKYCIAEDQTSCEVRIGNHGFLDRQPGYQNCKFYKTYGHPCPM